jgi:hypothetical protein
LALLLAPAPAAAETVAPPPVPSSYELRRLETQLRQVAAQQAAEARRKSRQRQDVGTGRHTGTGREPGIDITVTPELVVRAGIVAALGLAAVSAFSADSTPVLSLNGGAADSGSLTALPPVAATATR